MSLIVDASVAMKWLVDEAGSDAALRLRKCDLAAPTLLRIEVANVLWALAANGAMRAGMSKELFALFLRAPMELVEPDDTLEARALGLALEIGRPVGDCVYLALAERLGTRLITADQGFLDALGACGHRGRAVDLETWGAACAPD